MRTLHGIFDVNNDGVISFDDFEYLSKKFGDLGHLSEQEKLDFADILKVINPHFSCCDGDDPITFTIHLSHFRHTHITVDMGDELGRANAIQSGYRRAISC